VGRFWAFLVGLGLGIAGAVLYAFYRSLGRPQDALLARANATEEATQKAIAVRQAELASLREDIVTHAVTIDRLKAEIHALRLAVNEKFVAQGLSAEEIASRLARLGR
jgi:hypothetical protein